MLVDFLLFNLIAYKIKMTRVEKKNNLICGNATVPGLFYALGS